MGLGPREPLILLLVTFYFNTDIYLSLIIKSPFK